MTLSDDTMQLVQTLRLTIAQWRAAWERHERRHESGGDTAAVPDLMVGLTASIIGTIDCAHDFGIDVADACRELATGGDADPEWLHDVLAGRDDGQGDGEVADAPPDRS